MTTTFYLTARREWQSFWEENRERTLRWGRLRRLGKLAFARASLLYREARAAEFFLMGGGGALLLTARREWQSF